MIISIGGVGNAASCRSGTGAELAISFCEFAAETRSAIAPPICMKCPTAAAISSVVPAVIALRLSIMITSKTKLTLQICNIEMGHT